MSEKRSTPNPNNRDISMQLRLQQDIARPAQAVWAHLSTFSNVPWMLGMIDRIETVGEGIGMQRKLYRKHFDAPVVQQLDSLDHDQLKLSYHRISGPATTIKHWAIALEVVSISTSCSRVEALIDCELPYYANTDDMHIVVENMMATFFRRLQQHLESWSPEA